MVVTKLMWWISRLVIDDVRQPRPWQHVSTMPDLFLDFPSLWKKYDKNRNTMCWWMAIVVPSRSWTWTLTAACRWQSCVMLLPRCVLREGPHQSCLENSQVLKWRTKPWILLGCRSFFCRFQSFKEDFEGSFLQNFRVTSQGLRCQDAQIRH